jgi:hypothetical protein
MSRTCVVFQPTYLPWIGYFDLIDQADVFVLLDNVQFEKQSWQQRNRIRTFNGLEFLTVPVRIKGRFGQSIGEVELADPMFHLAQLRAIDLAYGRAPFHARYRDELAALLAQGAASGSLCALNTKLIRWFCRQFGIDTPILMASELAPEGKRSAMLVDLCRRTDTQTYLSTAGAWQYLHGEQHLFDDAGIALRLHAYEHPAYRQVYQPFVPYAAALDLLLNEGDAAGAIMRSGRRPSLTPAQMPPPTVTN